MTGPIDSFAPLRERIELALDEASQFRPVDQREPNSHSPRPDGLQSDGGCPDRLREAIRYSLLSSGKRLRPLLCLLSCEAVGGDSEDALPAAVAVEMIHAYSLIHDDLPAMDDDDLRRGRPTSHKQFDEATAILAGDALLTEAFLSLTLLRPELIRPCVADLAFGAGAAGMVGGQMADLLAETVPVSDADELSRIHRRKTGALIRAAVLLGGRCGGGTTAQLDALGNYGAAIGLAFQIADDLLDETGDMATIGKQVRKDSVRGKATYPGFLGVDESRRRAEELVSEAVRLVEPFGPTAQPLVQLARFAVDRHR